MLDGGNRFIGRSVDFIRLPRHEVLQYIDIAKLGKLGVEVLEAKLEERDNGGRVVLNCKPSKKLPSKSLGLDEILQRRDAPRIERKKEK